MAQIPDEDRHWDSLGDGETVARDLRQQIEAVKARMHDMRDGIAAAVNARNADESPENAG